MAPKSSPYARLRLIRPGGGSALPVNTGVPTLTGNPVIGTEYTATEGTWDGAYTLTYQWQRSADGSTGWTNISGATSIGYTPVPADYAYYLRVAETADGAVTAYSAASGAAVTVPAMTWEVTTTGAGQTYTIHGLTVSASTNVDWGDGSDNDYTGSGVRTHVYASAGTYTITINLPLQVTAFDLLDTKTSALTGVMVSHLRNLTSLTLYNLSGLTWTVGASVPMPTGLTSLTLYNLSGLTWTVGASVPMPTGLTYLNLNNLANLTWTVGASAPMPTGLTYLNLITLANLIVASDIAFGGALTTVQIESGLDQTEVDRVLLALYAAFPTRTGTNGTVDLLGGSNAAPSGTLGAACPPTTGNEAAYGLVNDPCSVSPNHWASVTVQT